MTRRYPPNMKRPKTGHADWRKLAPQPVPSIANDYPLRPDYMAQIVVPRDMTEREAERLCEFIKSLAQPK